MAGNFSLVLEGASVAITADDAKFAEVAPFGKGPSVGSLGDLTKVPFLDAAGKDAVRLVDLHDRMRDVAAVKEAEQAGLSRDVERESRLIDPATGDPMTIGQGRANAFDSGLGGRYGIDPWSVGKDKASRVTDPVTGQPLLGGSGGSGGPSQDDAMAAGRAGKGRAMDDGDVVTDTTEVFEYLTFGDAYILGTLEPLGTTNSVNGSTAHITAGKNQDGTRWVAIEHEKQPGGRGGFTVVYTEGESSWGKAFKPRPDDDGGTAPRKLTDAEKQAILKDLRGGFGPAAKPRPDDDGAGAGGSGGTGEVLTYLVLAGQPRPDDEGHRGGMAPNGPVTTGLGLAGQPVDDDPNFGVVILGGRGLQPPSPGFGGRLG